jgi:hypothetical protein
MNQLCSVAARNPPLLCTLGKMRASVVASLLAFVGVVVASPVKVELDGKIVDVELWDGPDPSSLEKRADPTTVSTATVSSFTTYTYYAGAAYCKPANTLAWNCGGEWLHASLLATVPNANLIANCNANKGFIPIASGGDGAVTQYCMKYFNPFCCHMIKIDGTHRVCRLRSRPQIHHRLPPGHRF